MSDKLIYTTAAGERLDPLAVHRRLIFATSGQFNTHLAAWTVADDDTALTALNRAAAEEKLVVAGRHGLQLKTFADGGPTDQEVLDELCRYLEWQAAKK